MTIDMIRKNIGENVGNKVKVKFNAGRNKIEEFEGTVKELYKSIFILESNNKAKSFTYSDVLTKTVELHFE